MSQNPGPNATTPISNGINVNDVDEDGKSILLAVLSVPNGQQVITPGVPSDGWTPVQVVGSDPFNLGTSSNTLAVYRKVGQDVHPAQYFFSWKYQTVHSSITLLKVCGTSSFTNPVDVSAGQADDIGDTPYFYLPQPPVPQAPAVTTTQPTAELLLTIIGSAEWQNYTPPGGLTLAAGIQANYASQAIYSSTAASPATYGPYTITATTTADFKTASIALY